MPLPIELVDHIACYLPPTDLCALAAASPRLYLLAQRQLYRNLALSESAPRSLRCVHTLARKPDIARHVRSFSIRLTPSAPLFAAFYRALAAALANMHGLLVLDLALPQDAAFVLPYAHILPHLHTFSSSLHLDPHMARFFACTPNLQVLTINDVLAPLAIPTTVLPRLAQFTGSSLAAQLLIPGRPVHDINLSSGDLTEHLAEAIAQSTQPVLALAAATASYSASLIYTLTRVMENLVHLRVVVSYNLSLPDDSIDHYSDIANAIRPLPHLKTGEIYGLRFDQGRGWIYESFNSTPPLDDLHPDVSFPY